MNSKKRIGWILALLLYFFPSYLINLSFQSEIGKSKLIITQESNNQWEKLCEYLVSMIVNRNNHRNGKNDVAIYFLQNKEFVFVYDGFFKTFQKYADFRIVQNLHDLTSKKIKDVYDDYMILLLHENTANYEGFLKKYFKSIRADLASKIFAIMTYKVSMNNLKIVWNALTGMKYYNLYLISHQSSGHFNMFRTNFGKATAKGFQIVLKKCQHNKFLTIREILAGGELPVLQIIFYDSYPLTYTRNNKITGADGNLIQEFSKKLQIPFKIANKNTSYPTATVINNYMNVIGDINLYTKIWIRSGSIKTFWLNDIHGLCLLIPRNIPVSVYEIYAFPMDLPTVIAAIISTLSVIACWRAITNEMSITSIIVAVGEMILNVRASGIERLTFRENVLIYCFIFSSFIMVSFYESIFVSFMLAESSMRSARSIKELNESNTKFYSFYDDNIAVHNRLPIIRKNLVLNYVHFNDLNSLNIPIDLDVNLVYMVSCDYAAAFLSSSRNYWDGQRLFEQIIITQAYKTYNVNSAFFYINDFYDFVERFLESGIYKFWSEQDFDHTSQELKNGNAKSNDRETIEFRDMGLPIFMLAIGCIVAFLVLLLEFVIHSLQDHCVNYLRNRNIQRNKIVAKRKLNLDKWSHKCIFKKNFKYKQKQQILSSKRECNSIIAVNYTHEALKCRETTGGGYFVFNKFSKSKLKRKVIGTRHRIIQVQPKHEKSTSHRV